MQASAGREPVSGGGLVGESLDCGLQPSGEASVVLALVEAQRAAEIDHRAGTPRPRAALAQDVKRAPDVHGHHGYIGLLGQERRAGTELLPPAVAGTAPLGIDHQAPAVAQQCDGLVDRASVECGSLDGDGADEQCRDRRRDAVPEEIVRSGADDEPVAPRLGHRGDDDSGVRVALMVGGEHGWPLQLAEPVDSLHGWLCVVPHHRLNRRVPRDTAGDPRGKTPSPVGVVVGPHVHGQGGLPAGRRGGPQREFRGAHDARH